MRGNIPLDAPCYGGWFGSRGVEVRKVRGVHAGRGGKEAGLLLSRGHF